MDDHGKTREQLIRELEALRRENDELRQAARHGGDHRFEEIFRRAPVGIFQSRVDGSEVLAVNQRLCEMAGMSEEELLAGGSFVHWEDPADRGVMVQMLMRDGAVQGHEIQMRAGGDEGASRSYLMWCKLQGEMGLLEGCVLDVMELRRTEAELRESIRRHGAVFEEADQAMIVGSMDGEVAWANEACHKLHGYGPGELLGLRADQLVSPDSDNDFSTVVSKSIEQGEVPFVLTGKGARKDGLHFDMRAMFTPLSSRGEPLLLGLLLPD